MDNKSPLSNLGWLDITILKNNIELSEMYSNLIPNWFVDVLVILIIIAVIYNYNSNKAYRCEYEAKRAERIQRALYLESITKPAVTSEWYTDANGNTYLINR